MNAPTLERGVRIMGPDGEAIAFTMEVGVDGRTVRLTPAPVTGQVTVVVDGVESREGAQAPVTKVAVR